MLYMQSVLPVALGAFNQDLEDLTMSQSDYIVRAARLERTIGRYAARRYMERNVDRRNWPIYTIARVLACAERAGL